MMNRDRFPTQRLLPHPASAASPPAIRLRVRLRPDGAGGCRILFLLTGNLDELRIPAPAATPGRADDLWRHTCCEAFIGHPDTPVYHEFNAAPCGQWAMYAFRDYRERDAARDPPGQPALRVRRWPGALALRLGIPRGALPSPGPDGNRAVGLAAVIEAADGSLSYWALQHPDPDTRPDFHRRASFILGIR